MKLVPISDIEDAIENNDGWCIKCKSFTTSQCEPDARQYKCESCGQKTVYGAEESLLTGFIAPKEEE